SWTSCAGTARPARTAGPGGFPASPSWASSSSRPWRVWWGSGRSRTWSTSSRAGRANPERSGARDRHLLDEQRAAADGPAQVPVVADRRDAPVELLQVAGDRDLVHGMHDLAVLDPEADRTARVIARDAVDSLPDQLVDDEAPRQRADQRGQVAVGAAHDEIVRAARVAGALQAQAPGGVGAQDVPLPPARGDEVAVAGRDPFRIERCARQRLGDVRSLLDRDELREDALPCRVEQERCSPVLRAAGDGADHVTDEAPRQLRREQDRRLRGPDLARAEP